MTAQEVIFALPEPFGRVSMVAPWELLEAASTLLAYTSAALALPTNSVGLLAFNILLTTVQVDFYVLETTQHQLPSI